MSNGKKSYGQIIILIVVVSLFFGANSAFASEIGPRPGPLESILPLFFLISMVIVPIALTYLGIVSVKHFKPNLWNYIHSNRFIKIGLYFLVEGISWFFYRVTQGWFDPQLRFGDFGTDYLVIFPIIPGIILISIGATKDRLSKTSRRTRIIFLIVGIGTVIFGFITSNVYILILGTISLTVCIITSIYNKVKKKDYTQFAE